MERRHVRVDYRRALKVGLTPQHPDAILGYLWEDSQPRSNDYALARYLFRVCYRIRLEAILSTGELSVVAAQWLISDEHHSIAVRTRDLSKQRTHSTSLGKFCQCHIASVRLPAYRRVLFRERICHPQFRKY